jgi:hypothetical protein
MKRNSNDAATPILASSRSACASIRVARKTYAPGDARCYWLAPFCSIRAGARGRRRLPSDVGRFLTSARSRQRRDSPRSRTASAHDQDAGRQSRGRSRRFFQRPRLRGSRDGGRVRGERTRLRAAPSALASSSSSLDEADRKAAAIAQDRICGRAGFVQRTHRSRNLLGSSGQLRWSTNVRIVKRDRAFSIIESRR